MHGLNIRLHVEDESLRSKKQTGKNAKRCPGQRMPQNVEANTSPEELCFGKSFKERHGARVMEIAAQSFFNFIPVRFMIEKNIYGKGIEQDQHANFHQDFDR